MKHIIEYGDTNFIAIINADRYESFVDEDWSLSQLLEHFLEQSKMGNSIIMQMTKEGVFHPWSVEFETQKSEYNTECYRTGIGYIEVTSEELYLVEYTCLTMAAQFEDEIVPDSNCSRYKVKIDNGAYRVYFSQYYDADEDNIYGLHDCDIKVCFEKVNERTTEEVKVLWSNL